MNMQAFTVCCAACLALVQPSPKHGAFRAADRVFYTEKFKFRILVVMQQRWHISAEIAAGKSAGRMQQEWLLEV